MLFSSRVTKFSLFTFSFALGWLFALLCLGYFHGLFFDGRRRRRHIIQLHHDRQSEWHRSDQVIGLLELLLARLLFLRQDSACVILAIGYAGCRAGSSTTGRAGGGSTGHLRFDGALCLHWCGLAFIESFFDQDVVLFRLNLSVLNLNGFR